VTEKIFPVNGDPGPHWPQSGGARTAAMQGRYWCPRADRPDMSYFRRRREPHVVTGRRRRQRARVGRVLDDQLPMTRQSRHRLQSAAAAVAAFEKPVQGRQHQQPQQQQQQQACCLGDHLTRAGGCVRSSSLSSSRGDGVHLHCRRRPPARRGARCQRRNGFGWTPDDVCMVSRQTTATTI